MNANEYLELKSLLLDLKSEIQLFLPAQASISYVSETTKKSRQTITQFLKNNFEPEVDYWEENGKIMLSRATLIHLLQRYQNVSKK